MTFSPSSDYAAPSERPHGSTPPALNALIVDDDPLACELLRHRLGRASPPVRVLAEIGTMREAETALTRTDYDLVFLDVQLIGGTGFDLVPLVRPHAAIVFVTSHDVHAVRAFNVNAVDYIVKPVNSARLAEALRRIGREPAPKKFQAGDSIFLRGAAAGGRFAAVSDLIAIVSAENYTEVFLADGARWLIRRTMDAWEQMLPGEVFARVHRTAIVNLALVERIERGEHETTSLKLRAVRHAIPVSRRSWPELRARLLERGLA